MIRFSDVRERCKRDKAKLDEADWIARNITIKVALPLTWVLLHTKITPNAVSQIGLFTGILAAICIGTATWWSFILAGFLIFLVLICDVVDGDISRFKNLATIEGNFWDGLSLHIAFPIILAGVAFSLFSIYGNVRWVIVGFVAVIAYFSLLLAENHAVAQSRNFIVRYLLDANEIKKYRINSINSKRHEKCSDDIQKMIYLFGKKVRTLQKDINGLYFFAFGAFGDGIIILKGLNPIFMPILLSIHALMSLMVFIGILSYMTKNKTLTKDFLYIKGLIEDKKK